MAEMKAEDVVAEAFDEFSRRLNASGYPSHARIAHAIVTGLRSRAASMEGAPKCEHEWHFANVTGQRSVFQRCAKCGAERGQQFDEAPAREADGGLRDTSEPETTTCKTAPSAPSPPDDSVVVPRELLEAAADSLDEAVQRELGPAARHSTATLLRALLTGSAGKGGRE